MKLTFIELDGAFYRLDMISTFTQIKQREQSYYEFTITCDQTKYTFGTGGNIRYSTLETMYESLVEAINAYNTK
jgi:hypothetical protein